MRENNPATPGENGHHFICGTAHVRSYLTTNVMMVHTCSYVYYNYGFKHCFFFVHIKVQVVLPWKTSPFLCGLYGQDLSGWQHFATGNGLDNKWLVCGS